jgi:4-hydroxy-2-oxoheptanedioate aldolase
LGLSLGYEPTLEPASPEVLEAIYTIALRAKAAGRIAGVYTGSLAMVRRMLAQGFDFASLHTDVRLFTSAVAAQLAAVHEKTAETVKGY